MLNVYEFILTTVLSCYRYMVVRQLLSTSGESYVKDLINTPQTYLVPGDVKEALESFVVPDVLSVYGGDMYLTAKEAFNKLITESASSGESFDKAFNDFKQVRRI